MKGSSSSEGAENKRAGLASGEADSFWKQVRSIGSGFGWLFSFLSVGKDSLLLQYLHEVLTQKIANGTKYYCGHLSCCNSVCGRCGHLNHNMEIVGGMQILIFKKRIGAVLS